MLVSGHCRGKDLAIVANVYINLNCSLKVIGPSPVNSTLFMPKILKMNESGTWMKDQKAETKQILSV